MKNLIILFIVAASLFSCSSDDNTVAPPKVLQKIVFYKNTPNQRQWNFSNGLLTSITYADGTVAEQFTYDALKRLSKDVKYATNGTQIESNIIAYNADNTIKAVDNLPYTYNPVTRKYAYSYGSNFTIDCLVNEDMLAVDFVRTGVNPGEYHMTYDNGKMTSFKKVNNGSSDIVKNFHFGGYGQNDFIYNAILAIARVKSLTDPGFFVDCQVSKIKPEGYDLGPSVPYYYNFGLVTGTNYESYGIEVLDSNNNAVDWYSYADYYYE